MQVAIRVDCSTRLGTGHVLRCRSLAAALDSLGAQVAFVTRLQDAASTAIFETFPYQVIWLDSREEDRSGPCSAHHVDQAAISWESDADETARALANFRPDWVCVDHYALDADWHKRVRDRLGCRVLAIDDLGNRPIAADILLDANVSHDHAAKYRGRLLPSVRGLFGPHFALLAPAYRHQHRYAFNETVRSIGIFMGGTDPDGASELVLCECRTSAGFVGPLEVVSTSANPRLTSLREACARDGNATLTVDLPDLAEFYVRHDLQIGAGGTSSYERCYLGVPTVGVVLAANQMATVPILHDLRVIRGASLPGLEISRQLADFPALPTVLGHLIEDCAARHELARNARQLVDGRGAERVALKLLADSLLLRPATSDDAALTHAWRNHPATRAVSVTSEEIAYTDHVRWLDGVLASASRRLFIATIGQQPVGVIRFDKVGDCAWGVSLYTDPGLHGIGIGKRMLAAGEDMIATIAGRHVEFRAQVVLGNTASARMFERAGYSGQSTRLIKTRRKR